MANIKKNIVPSSVASKVTYSGTNSKRYLILHETDNIKVRANADAHSRLQYNGNARAASWHYQVDSKEIIQSFSDNTQCWAAGSRYYNENGIQIEICVNSDGDFNKAIQNTVDLVRHLMKKYNIPASRVLQHHTTSGGKNCPRNIRAGKGMTWSKFKSEITKTGGLTVKQYNDLKAMIDASNKRIVALEKENKSLKTRIGKKQDKFSTSQDAGDHTSNWVKVSSTVGTDGKTIMNGMNPNQPITRAQHATTLVRAGLVK